MMRRAWFVASLLSVQGLLSAQSPFTLAAPGRVTNIVRTRLPVPGWGNCDAGDGHDGQATAAASHERRSCNDCK